MACRGKKGNNGKRNVNNMEISYMVFSENNVIKLDVNDKN